MVKYKESESESEGAVHTEEPRFRISVCMKRFYSDERARAYVCVSARRRVRWLQRRLRQLFALPQRFLLLCRGHLLPRDEPLVLLDRDDLVEVVPMHDDINCVSVSKGNDVVDSVDPKEELRPCERILSPVNLPSHSSPISRSPVRADDLTETKRRALLMLEQLTAAVQPVAAGAGTRPRRRVRRRRRAPARLQHTPSGGNITDVGGGEDDKAMHVTDQERSEEFMLGGVFREPEAGSVLRNGLAPRAPRLVRPLGQQSPVPPLSQ